MTKHLTATLFLMGAIATTVATPSFAAGKESTSKSDQQALSPDLKRDMAEMYIKMGECMKTDKSQEQCQKDIMKDCPVAKKTGHCPLMDGMKPMMGDHSKMKGMNHSGH